MNDKKFDLEDRFVQLAANIALFCKDLPSNFAGNYYGNQLLRSGGSAALNFGEAQGTITNKDYRFKASLVLKELKESRVNLRILDKISYGSEQIKHNLLDEIEQLVKIISTIIKNKTP
ncbi:four helix bundle protein [Flagellimonas pacifica]|uniref:Four helix bundle protein n=1 Tax=Flagellimonas pacifica TaxID=1247520 RepID=A0A285MCR8_9FLAO|nr:four helix bundle protein [Allomuricauda parva]SNY94878.1 four helix bundle protein [Allomuricauda parva]